MVVGGGSSGQELGLMGAESSSDAQRTISVRVRLSTQAKAHPEHKHKGDSASHDGEVLLDLLVRVHVEPRDIRCGCCGVHDLSLTSALAGLQVVGLDCSRPTIVRRHHRQGGSMRPSSPGHGSVPQGAPQL